MTNFKSPDTVWSLDGTFSLLLSSSDSADIRIKPESRGSQKIQQVVLLRSVALPEFHSVLLAKYLITYSSFMILFSEKQKCRPITPWLAHDKGQKLERLAERVFWCPQEASRSGSCSYRPLQSKYASSVASPRGTSKCLFLLFLTSPLPVSTSCPFFCF